MAEIFVQKALIKEKGILRLNGINASFIRSLLEKRHIDDVYVDECKNGETWGARDLLKLDAWVLKRTYSPLTTIGYEIKCSRQDFEQDQKWTGYLDVCHLFYFVCPAGLIRAEDLPSRVGIIWASKNSLHVKRKSERVTPDTEKLNRLLIYVLMARSKIVANMYEINKSPEEDRLTELRRVVEESEARRELAYFVGKHFRSTYERVMKADMAMAGRENMVKRFEEKLAMLGITWDSTSNAWMDTMRVENEIDHLKKRLDVHTIQAIRSMGQRLTETAELLEQFHKAKAVSSLTLGEK